jgi:selenocysteine-specific elongation factor
VVTIGGGEVLDLPTSLRSTGAAERLALLAASDAPGRIALLVREAEFGAGMQELVARTGWRETDLAAAATSARLIAVADSWYVDGGWFRMARGKLVDAVRAHHRENPLAPGIAKQELRARAMPRIPPFLLDALLVGQTNLAAPDLSRSGTGQPGTAASREEIVVEGETVRLRSHTVVLKEDEEQALAAIERTFESAGLAVPAMAEALAKSGVEAKRARTLLEILVRQKRLLRINEDLVFHASALERLRQILAARKSQYFGVGEFKEWTGISRKYAIPLLEYLDREHITRREGDRRLIL